MEVGLVGITLNEILIALAYKAIIHPARIFININLFGVYPHTPNIQWKIYGLWVCVCENVWVSHENTPTHICSHMKLCGNTFLRLI